MKNRRKIEMNNIRLHSGFTRATLPSKSHTLSLGWKKVPGPHSFSTYSVPPVLVRAHWARGKEREKTNGNQVTHDEKMECFLNEWYYKTSKLSKILIIMILKVMTIG